MTVSQQNELSYLGVQAPNPPNLIKALVDPTASDYKHPIGTLWVNTANTTVWQLANVTGTTASWVSTGGGTTEISTLTGDAGGAISPVAGNIILAGGVDITTTGAGHTITFDLDANLTQITSITATAASDLNIIMADNAGVHTVNFKDSDLALVASIDSNGGFGAVSGAVTNDFTTTSGNLIINGAAKQLRVHGGAVTDFIGTATLVAGTKTVANTNIAATDRIFLSRSSSNTSTVLGALTYSITPATSFTINSEMLNTPGSLETGDTSIVSYFIVRQV